MKILAICSSPRSKSNSTQLAEDALEAARAAGAETEVVDVGRLELRGCLGDLVCKKRGRCGIKDNMQPIYAKVEEADGVLLASPIYGFTVNAQMKTVLDRFYAFLNPDMSPRLAPGKRTALIVTQGDAREDEFLPYLGSVTRTLEFGGFGAPEILVGASLGGPGEVLQRPELRERARQLGQRLAQRA